MASQSIVIKVAVSRRPPDFILPDVKELAVVNFGVHSVVIAARELWSTLSTIMQTLLLLLLLLLKCWQYAGQQRAVLRVSKPPLLLLRNIDSVIIIGYAQFSAFAFITASSSFVYKCKRIVNSFIEQSSSLRVGWSRLWPSPWAWSSRVSAYSSVVSK